MRTPTIHLNGTGRETLIEEASNALVKLEAAREAICKITVHGRDFYPQDLGLTNATMQPSYNDARKQFNALLVRLDLISEEIAHYAHAIIDGGAKINP